MKPRQKMSLLTVLGIISMTLGHVESQIAQGDPPKNFCGRSLARVLAYVCSDPGPNYADKRSGLSGPATMYDSLLLPYYAYYEAQQQQKQQRNNEIEWSWMTPHKARSMAVPARGKRGVVDECCDKPCDLDELITYC